MRLLAEFFGTMIGILTLCVIAPVLCIIGLVVVAVIVNAII